MFQILYWFCQKYNEKRASICRIVTEEKSVRKILFSKFKKKLHLEAKVVINIEFVKLDCRGNVGKYHVSNVRPR